MWRAEGPACLVIGRGRLDLAFPGASDGTEAASRSILSQSQSLDVDADGDPSQTRLQAALLQLAQSARELGGDRLHAQPLRVLVSATWLCSTNLPWSKSLMRTASATPYAQDQLRAAGFDIAAGDTLKIEDAPYRAMRLAVAYPASLMAAIQDAVRRMDMVLETVLALPMVATGFARKATGDAAGVLALIDGGAVGFFQWGRAGFAPIGQEVTLTPGVGLEVELQRLWRRHQLRDPSLAMPDKSVSLLDLDAERMGDGPVSVAGFRSLDLPADQRLAAESPRMRVARSGDMLSPTLGVEFRQRGVTRLGMAGAITAAVLAGTAVYMAARDAVEVRQQESALAAMSLTPTATRRAAPNKEAMVRIVSINTAISALNLPIGDLLKALQPPPDIRVGLLSLEVLPPKVDGGVVGADAMVKLRAEAASESEMARYVMFLGSRPPFTEAYLLNHETHESDRSVPYRFNVEALWQP